MVKGKILQVVKDKAMMQRLDSFLKRIRIEDITDVTFHKGLYFSFLYPTADLWLSAQQFDSFEALTDQNNFYVMQVGEKGEWYDESTPVFEVCYPYDYQAYSCLNLWSVTIIFTKMMDWVLILDETRESGIGIFAGTLQSVQKFESIYKPCKTLKKALVDNPFMLPFFQKMNIADT